MLAILFKIIERTTHLKVYTFLLNVDYIPYINRFIFSELVEVSFHLIVSIILAFSLYLLIVYRQILSKNSVIRLCTLFCFFTGAALFPTTAFSDRTPALSSIPSLLYWLIGHIAYGYVLGALIARGLLKKGV